MLVAYMGNSCHVAGLNAGESGYHGVEVGGILHMLICFYMCASSVAEQLSLSTLWAGAEARHPGGR